MRQGSQEKHTHQVAADLELFKEPGARGLAAFSRGRIKGSMLTAKRENFPALGHDYIDRTDLLIVTFYIVF